MTFVMEKYRKGEKHEDTTWSEEKVTSKRKDFKIRITETRKDQEKQKEERGMNEKLLGMKEEMDIQ